MIEQAPILITGIPRSGTSMIAAAIKACGAFSGEISKRGRYSNDKIREEMIKPYLYLMGGDTEGHYPLPNELSPPIDWKDKIDQIMIDEGYKDGMWMYKDSRLGLTWKVWNNAYRNAKWIIVRRRTADILHSCIETKYMTRFGIEGNRQAVNAKDEREGWLWMVHQYEKRFVAMIRKGLNCKQIWPERMVQGDYQQIYEVCDWLGLSWKEEALDFINPLLWGGKRKRKG